MTAGDKGAELAAILADMQSPERAALQALPVGLHESVPPETYHARVLGFASRGACDQIARAPASYRAWIDGLRGTEDTTAMRLGRALHMAALEPARFADRYVVEPDWGDCRKADNKRRRDEWRGEHKGREPIEPEDMARILGMIRSVLEHPIARPLIEQARAELTARWQERVSGLPAKARPDLYVRELGVIADLKSTEDASADGFAKSCERYRYYVQDPWYREGLERLDCPADHFIFIAVEKTPPYLCNVHHLDDDYRAAGEQEWKRNVELLARCMETGVWPGYEERIHTVERPRWAQMRGVK